ncbi:MAG: ArnT family glycosyltransferase [Pirellulaceae bacterium]
MPPSARYLAASAALLFLLGCGKQLLTWGIGPGPLISDAQQYWELSGEVLRGDWMLSTSGLDYRTPFYPVFLAGMRWLFAEQALLATVVVQHGLFVVTHLLVAGITWRLTGSGIAALLAYGVTVVSLMETWFANVVGTEAWFMLFLTAAAGALCLYHERPSGRWAMVFGCLFGVAALVRPVPKLLWIPLVGVFALHATSWVPRRVGVLELMRHALAAAGVTMLILAPWCGRNACLFGEPFLARLPAVNKWQVCFQGGSAAALAIPVTPEGNRIRALIGDERGQVRDRYCYAVIGALEQRGLSDRQIDELVTAVCVQAVAADPWGFAWPAFKRCVNYWRCVPNGIPYYDVATDGGAVGRPDWEWAGVADFQRRVLRRSPAHWVRWNELVLALCIAGTWQLVRRRSTRLMGISVALIFLYFTAVTSLVEIENFKYRVVLEPCVIFATVSGWYGCWRGRHRPADDGASHGQGTTDTVPYGWPFPRGISQWKEAEPIQASPEHDDPVPSGRRYT